MLELLLAATVGLVETQCCGEDGTTALLGLYRPRDIAPSITYSFHVVQYRDFGVTGEEEVTVHAMDSKIGGNSS